MTAPPARAEAGAYRDPAWLVQCAWSDTRLSVLQALIKTTISALENMDSTELLGRPPSDSPTLVGDPNPVKEALQACCEELRDACGMVDSEAQRAGHHARVRLHMAEQPVAWTEAFIEALDKYRRAASVALSATLQRKPLTGPQPPREST